MVKKSKRKQDIKSKLLAAIAMLMVATIMMVSSTYAWFTLSTAPEVQGITTNVGANGNLEIALSPLSGDASEIISGTNDSGKTWVEKNLTWGNLLDLSDASYGLGNINLLPAQLNLASLGTNPLKTPIYGADGRIERLEANTSIGGLVAGKEGYIVSDDAGYGVRVVGTSSNMTEYQIAFQNNLSAMNAAVKSAHDLAEMSLNANGATLAEIAIAHASVTTDNNNYVSYVPALEDMVAKLQEANDELEAAIRAALLATASSDMLVKAGQTADNAVLAYNAMVALVTDAKTLPEIWAEIPSQISGTAIGTAYTVWAGVDDDLNNATNGAAVVLAGLDTNATVGWDAISSVITKLMATNGVTINNMQLGDLKGQINIFLAGDPNQRINDYKDGEGNWNDGTGDTFNADVQAYREAQALVGTLTRGVELQLGAGSGVYADLASAVGNIHAAVQNVMITVPGMGAVPADVSIDTTTGTSAALVSYKATLQGLGALTAGATGSDMVINVNYAYIVDFMFRTNASGSNLKLQTAAAQRIYEGSSNEATQGAGSTMTFYSTALNEQAVKGLMDAMRVVFMDTTSGELLGIAKLDMNEVTTADDTVDGNAVKKITANLYLYNYTQDENGKLTFTTQIADDDATLCALQANTAKAVSAMVYLDGDYVTNENVAAEVASSLTGELNLQFASTAELVPMENSALQNGTGSNP
jgi:hypothetical protein